MYIYIYIYNITYICGYIYIYKYIYIYVCIWGIGNARVEALRIAVPSTTNAKHAGSRGPNINEVTCYRCVVGRSAHLV